MNGILSTRPTPAVARPLVGALVAGVTEHHRFIAVQQLVGLRHVGHVAGSGHQGMRQARLGIDADMGLHAEEPVLAFLRLVHPPGVRIVVASRD